MYQSNAFKNFVNAQAKQFGHRYKSYAEEFKRYNDEELLQAIRSHAGQLQHYTFGNQCTHEDAFKIGRAHV